jgi:hypothetical protein
MELSDVQKKFTQGLVAYRRLVENSGPNDKEQVKSNRRSRPNESQYSKTME